VASASVDANVRAYVHQAAAYCKHKCCRYVALYDHYSIYLFKFWDLEAGEASLLIASNADGGRSQQCTLIMTG